MNDDTPRHKGPTSGMHGASDDGDAEVRGGDGGVSPIIGPFGPGVLLFIGRL